MCLGMSLSDVESEVYSADIRYEEITTPYVCTCVIAAENEEQFVTSLYLCNMACVDVFVPLTF